ncbi:hypothetical protein JRO89_XS04G0213900 [Xanthoceras sorbifolium]|uniref:Uncharacterized protein n=1 Tax=Xanthoceras sorbifolium TaxID=99658 RepID=A0ABQ8I6A2_9ROSI|nr:hypothetical protein JRO89_XS04G0213900 [Xanthoceras sorbifolium]
MRSLRAACKSARPVLPANQVASPGAAQEALPLAPAPAEVAPDQEERAALREEVKTLIVQQLQEEELRMEGVRLSVHFPEMREVYSSTAENIMSYDLEISKQELLAYATAGLQGRIGEQNTAGLALIEASCGKIILQSSEHGVLLKKVLYDAVILVEYSFLNSGHAVDLPVELMKSLAMTRLILTQEAIELLREDGDQKKAISYASAFSSSKLPSQIIKWITNQIGIDEKERSFGSSPKALLKWLLSLENQGIRAFDDKILKCRAKLAVDNSKTDYQSSKVLGNEASGDLLFYIDNKGEEEDEDEEDEQQKRMNESMSVAFVAAAQSMKLPENSGRKRKESRNAGNKKKIKYLKHDLSDNHGSTREGFSSVSNEDLSSESEVDDPISDEDAETEEQ